MATPNCRPAPGLRAASYDEALAIARRLAARDPGNALWQSDPWIAFYKLGEAKLSLGDTAAARGFYAHGLPIIRRLVSADPGNLQRRINLVFSLYRLASVQDGFERKHALKEALRSSNNCKGKAADARRDRLAGFDPANAGVRAVRQAQYRGRQALRRSQ